MGSLPRLAADEKLVFQTRTHWVRLALPVVVLVATGVLVYFVLQDWIPDPQTQAWARWSLGSLLALIAIMFGVWPILRWLGATDTLTTRRLISRRGVLRRSGRDVPVDRVVSVGYTHSLVERVLGSGTLTIHTVGDETDVALRNIPHLEQRLVQVEEILVSSQSAADRDARVALEAHASSVRSGDSIESTHEPAESVPTDPEHDSEQTPGASPVEHGWPSRSSAPPGETRPATGRIE